MAKQPRPRPGGDNGDRLPVINLEGLGADEPMPDMVVTAWSRGGDIIHTSSVADDRTFQIPDKVVKEAHRVRIGPKDAEPGEQKEIGLVFRADRFREVLETGVIDVGRPIWVGWHFLLRCVTGRVRVCHHSRWWLADLERFATLPLVEARRHLTPSTASRALIATDTNTDCLERTTALVSDATRISPAASIDQLIAWPFRCAPVCQGTVEVYRRVCCCEPWIVLDPRIPELIRELEDIVRVIPDPRPDPIPDPIPGPRPVPPGPDPAPMTGQMFFKEGALDEITVRAAQDLQALRSLPAVQVAEYINARPYLLCRSYSCGAPVKVAKGQLGPDGRFNICWRTFPYVLRFGCHEEFSYIVKQSFGPFQITIYNGVAANRWHRAGDDPTLTSYHPFAYGCRENPAGAFVFLDLIGDTGAHELVTPDADSAESVANPVYNSGLVFPAPNAAAAIGTNLNRNWGGTLKLSYMFAEGLQDVGAKFYRISVVEAGANGDPTGTRYFLSDGLSWNKSVSDGMGGVDIVPVALGPTSAGSGTNVQNFLYEIPYDTNPTTDWNAGQYHAYLNTNDPRWSDPDKRHLVMIEIFDASGKRLRPSGTPATGLGGLEGTAAFTYRRRYQETGDTLEVPFGALTHTFWWDNRDVFADIVDLRKSGLVFNAECLFFGGNNDTTFSVGYRAYHPNEMFQLYHNINWRRGLGSTAASFGNLQPLNSNNVGAPPAVQGGSATNTFAQMLRPDLDPTRKKCAFTAFLNIWNKRTDGDDLGHQYRGDTAAFVIEIES
jgi:hypothetical protein